MPHETLKRLFDPLHYLLNRDVPDDAFADPLQFYSQHWREYPHLDPHPLFDNQWYIEQLDGDLSVSPLEHYLSPDRMAKPSPNMFFDEEFYRRTQMLDDSHETSALEHYLRHFSGPQPPTPNAVFDPIYFQRHNRDIVESGINPLETLLHHPNSATRLYSKALTRAMLHAFDYPSGPRKDNYKPLRCILIILGDLSVWTATLDAIESLKDAGTAEILAITTKENLDSLKARLKKCAVSNKHLFSASVGELNLIELASSLKGLVSPHKPTWILTDTTIPDRLTFGAQQIPISSASVKLPKFERSITPAKQPKVIIPISDWQISGVNTWVSNISTGLQKNGWEVELLCCHDFYRFTDTSALPPVTIREIHAPSSKSQFWWACVRDYVNQQLNAVFLTAYDFQFNAIAAACDVRIPMIGVIHSDDPVYYRQTERLGGSWHHIITVSEHIANELAVRHPEWKDKISAVHYGVEKWLGALPNKPQPTEPIRLIYTGRIVHEQKQLLHIPLLLDHLDQLQTPFELHLVGDGPDFRELQNSLATRINSGSVVMHGRLPHSEIHQLLAQSHIFLLISDYEGLPLSLLEAMSHGLVPVVSDIASGIPEVIQHGETGYRAPIGDYATFAKLIAQLHSDPELWSQNSKKSKAFFEQELTVEVMTARTEKVIRDIYHSERRDNFEPMPYPLDKLSLTTKVFGDVITNLTEA